MSNEWELGLQKENHHKNISKLCAGAVIHAFLSPLEHGIDVHQREHGEGSDEGAGLDGDAAPQQGGVTRLVQQSPDHHLHVGVEAGENDPGDDL